MVNGLHIATWKKLQNMTWEQSCQFFSMLVLALLVSLTNETQLTPVQIALSIRSALVLVEQSRLWDYFACYYMYLACYCIVTTCTLLVTALLLHVPCLLLHASVNILASFHATRAMGCLFGKLVQISCCWVASYPGRVGEERRPGIDCLRMRSRFRYISVKL